MAETREETIDGDDGAASGLVRMLLNRVPIAVTARLHDTSVKQIEADYGAYIADFADDVSRPALLDMSAVQLLPVSVLKVAQGGRPGFLEAEI